MQTGRRIMRGPAFQLPGAFGNPGGMFKYATEFCDKVCFRQIAGTKLVFLKRIGFLPVPGNVETCRKPDRLVTAGIFQKASYCHDTTRPADQATMQTNRHHLCRTGCAFAV